MKHLHWISYLVPADPATLMLLDFGLDIAHVLLVVFVCFAWILWDLRHAHLAVALFVWWSWYALGWYVGQYGYFPLTDWLWQIKEARGVTGLPPTYMEYMYRWVSPRSLEDDAVFGLSVRVLGIVTAISLFHVLRRGYRALKGPGRHRLKL